MVVRKEILYYSVPMLSVAFLSLINLTVAGVFASGLALIFCIVRPSAAIPVILFSSATQPLISVGSVRVGWFIVIFSALGLIINLFLRSRIVDLNRPLVVVVVVYLILGIISTLVFESKIDRLLALITLLFVILIIESKSKEDFGRYTDNQSLSYHFIYSMIFVGALLTLLVVYFIQTGLIVIPRASEMSIRIGEAVSSPRPLSNIMGFSGVIGLCVALHCKFIPLLGRFIVFTFGVVSLFGLVYTGSRMPMIAAFIAISVSFISAAIFSRSAEAIISLGNTLALAVLFAAFFLLYQSTIGDVGGISLFDTESLRLTREVEIEDNVRLILWADYLQELTLFQLMFGGGIAAIHNPHSVYVGAFAVFGIIGLLILLYFIFSVFRKMIVMKSVVGLSALAYTIVSMSSSSDIDRIHFWVMMMSSILVGFYLSKVKVNQ